MEQISTSPDGELVATCERAFEHLAGGADSMLPHCLRLAHESLDRGRRLLEHQQRQPAQEAE